VPASPHNRQRSPVDRSTLTFDKYLFDKFYFRFLRFLTFRERFLSIAKVKVDVTFTWRFLNVSKIGKSGRNRWPSGTVLEDWRCRSLQTWRSVASRADIDMQDAGVPRGRGFKSDKRALEERPESSLWMGTLKLFYCILSTTQERWTERASISIQMTIVCKRFVWDDDCWLKWSFWDTWRVFFRFFICFQKTLVAIETHKHHRWVTTR
jgi:hypothetical protein